MTEEISWQTDPLWFKDAIIYQTHVKAFGDSNNDGVGDFKGLTERLDYIQDLGVNTLWLLPFYPSPMRDDGYDIADYRNISPDYGTRRDFKNFVRAAHKRGLKVITELVINHTSDQNPWFQAARRAPKGSRKRNFYVWNDDAEKFPETRIIFTDTETSNWAWDPVAHQYYWHRFFSHQPDLNHNNPDVVKAVIKILRHWLDMGVDGVRLDAIPYLCVREGTTNENLPETHDVIKQMRAVVDAHYEYRMFLAEANQWPEDVREYFGDGDECHMAYHFPLMPRMYMAVAQEDRHPIVEIMEQTPDIPEYCQWAVFLRNHDELTLEMVTDRERDYMYQTYAADPRMRVNVGIRRRLAPLMDNDMAKIKLMNTLLMSMPGSPIVYYGDEIGMGDNVFLGDRNGVRTPMQWSPDRNAGFSRADPQRLFLPPIMDPIYGYEAVNVEAQLRSPSSLLNWMKRLIAVRKRHQAFGRGTLEFIKPGNRKILAYLREYQDETILCVVNLSRSAQPVELDLARFNGLVPIEMTGQTPFPPIGELPYLLTLRRHGFFWFHLTKAEAPVWHDEYRPSAELPVLVLTGGWKNFFPDEVAPSRRSAAEKLQRQLVGEILPKFLVAQRWFAAKGEIIEAVEIAAHTVWTVQDRGDWPLLQLRVKLSESGIQHYFLPLSLAWEQEGEEGVGPLGSTIIARARSRAQMGVLYDGFADVALGRALLDALATEQAIPFGDGRLVCSTTSKFRELVGEDPESLPIIRPPLDSSNTIIFIGQRLLLKGYRRLQEGINLELEMGRFLTETSPFDHIVPLAGAVEYQGADGTRMTLALLMGFVENQGDGWAYSQDMFKRYLEDCLIRSTEPEVEPDESEVVYILQARTLGQRTGELHQALARETGDPDFDPEPIQPTDIQAWIQQISEEATQTLEKLARHRDNLAESQQGLADELLEQRAQLLDSIASLAVPDLQAAKTRYHGDYHLGQVLVVENDFVIIDFEGEPARSMEERRRKHSPLKDVAGMLRSFDYAAHNALMAAMAEMPEQGANLEGHARNWRDRVMAAFMEGYLKAAEGCPSYPREPAHAQALIDLFTLEKALYEVRYELDNRPTWVTVPIRGLLRLLE